MKACDDFRIASSIILFCSIEKLPSGSAAYARSFAERRISSTGLPSLSFFSISAIAPVRLATKSSDGSGSKMRI
jgi:hypothetical protein